MCNNGQVLYDVVFCGKCGQFVNIGKVIRMSVHQTVYWTDKKKWEHGLIQK